MSCFEKLGVIAEVIKAIEQPELDWLLPTNVQDEAIPLILGGGDVMVAAETGSGKTAAFGIPILQCVYETLRGEGGTAAVSSSKGSSSGGQSSLNDQVPSVQLSRHDCHEMFNIFEDNLSAESRAGWQGGRANIGLLQGKYYYEVTVVRGLARIGWSTRAGKYDIGKDAQSWGYGGTGVKAFASEFVKYGDNYGDSDVVGCKIDFESRSMEYTKNGKSMGIAHNFESQSSEAIFPTAIVKNGELRFNFGKLPFRFQAKGYSPIQSAPVRHTNVQFRQQRKLDSGGANTAAPLALIIAPTRDLVEQLFNDVNKLKKFLTEPPVNTALCIGGVGKMMAELKNAHIVFGTCGSLVGMIQSKKLVLSKCKFFVIDEADRVLDSKQGQQNNIKAFYSRLPQGVQVMLFSATLHSDDITNMSQLICNHPQWVDLKGKEYVPDTVHHCILVVDPIKDDQWRDQDQPVTTCGVHHHGDKVSYRAQKLNPETISEGSKKLKPIILKKVIDAFKMDQCLIFCRTRLDCDNLEKFLIQCGGGQKFRGKIDSGKENPYSCVVLHSGRQQHERRGNLHMFKEGDCRFMICTDVAARGIDIKQLPYVINMTMPAESEDYIHRVGRVGRADHTGVAISILSNHKEKVWYHKCATRGEGCTNTRLVEQGGCAIWFDELNIFQQVEQRLGNVKIPILNQNDLHPDRVNQFVQTIARKDPLVMEAEKKVEALKPRLVELAELEVEAQNGWLMMPLDFKNIAKH